MEWMFGLVLLGLAGISYLFQQHQKASAQRKADEARAERRSALSRKYGDSPHLSDLMNGTIRIGMTMEQVIDSWGQPDAVEERVLKTKTTQTLKYGQINSRTFKQQVKFENGLVVGWSSR